MLKGQIIGNLGRDAELKSGAKGQFLTFSVGVKVYGQEESTWVNVVSSQINLAQYLTKGTKVYVDGSLSVKTYTNKNGETVAQVNLSASTIQLLGSKNDSLVRKVEPEQSDMPF